MPVAISVSRNEILGINCLSLTFYQFFRVDLNHILNGTAETDMFWLLPADGVLIGYSHHIPWLAMHFCGSICLMLIQYPSWWISFLCSIIIYFLTKLVVWSHKICKIKGKEFIWGLLIFYLLIGQRLSYRAFLPPYIHIVESDLFHSWLQATTFIGSVKIVHKAWRN